MKQKLLQQDLSPNCLTGIILAGGKSSRMGSEKGLLQLGHTTMIEWTIAILRQFCNRIIISSNSQFYSHLNYEIVADFYSQSGPMAGLHAGLMASETDHNLVLSCDMPFVHAPIIERLIGSVDQNLAAVACINNIPIPVCGYYHRKVLPLIESELDKGLLKMNGFIHNIGAHLIHFEDVESERRLLNINTFETYEKAKNLLATINKGAF